MIDGGDHERGRGASFSDFIHVSQKIEPERGMGA
jgi:hypothetical protein